MQDRGRVQRNPARAFNDEIRLSLWRASRAAEKAICSLHRVCRNSTAWRYDEGLASMTVFLRKVAVFDRDKLAAGHSSCLPLPRILSVWADNLIWARRCSTSYVPNGASGPTSDSIKKGGHRYMVFLSVRPDCFYAACRCGE